MIGLSLIVSNQLKLHMASLTGHVLRSSPGVISDPEAYEEQTWLFPLRGSHVVWHSEARNGPLSGPLLDFGPLCGNDVFIPQIGELNVALLCCS